MAGRSGRSPAVPPATPATPADGVATGTTRLRVVLVAHDVGDGGGMERAMYELVRGAHDRVDFTVVSTTLAADLRPFVRWRRVPTPRRPFIAKYLAFFVAAPWRYRRRDTDVVHTLGAIVPRRADVMAVHFCHAAYRDATRGMDLDAGLPALRRWNVAAAFAVGLLSERVLTRPRFAGMATAVSTGAVRELNRFFPRVRVTKIPNGVDGTRYRPDPARRAAARAAAGVGDAEVVALFVGGRWSQKGLGVVLRGLARARRTAPLLLWVAGTGDVRRYQALADELGVGGSVQFLGQVADTERLYAAADLFVLPSAYETFCLVAHEAASAGLPVVATAVNGVEDLLHDGSAGILVAAAPDPVGEALSALARDVGCRTSMGRAARDHVAGLTWAATAAQTVELYDAVARSAGRRA